MAITCTTCGTAKRVRTRPAKAGKIRGLYCPTCQRGHQRAWEERNPEKTQAHSLIARAKKRGIIKPEPCEACGSKPAQAHHDDYADQLTVRWLCQPCHMAHHREMRSKMSKVVTARHTQRLTG